MFKQSTLTKKWNYNIFAQTLYSYFQLVISDTLVGAFLDILFMLLVVILSEFYENKEGIKIELQKKVHRRICVRNITFLIARPPFYDIFCYFFCLLRFPVK